MGVCFPCVFSIGACSLPRPFSLTAGEYIAVEHLENVYNHVEELEQVRGRGG